MNLERSLVLPAAHVILKDRQSLFRYLRVGQEIVPKSRKPYSTKTFLHKKQLALSGWWNSCQDNGGNWRQVVNKSP